MIRVLQNWEEIGRATKFLEGEGLPRHVSPEKCWDLHQLFGVVKGYARSAAILDMGCGGVHILNFLHAMGFSELAGIDLEISVFDRLAQLSRMRRERTWRQPFRLRRSDLTSTRFPSNRFDFITCVSVLEHGVDQQAFLREASRLLRPGGTLFITADYWEDPLDMSDAPNPFGLPWKVLSRQDVMQLIKWSSQMGLELYSPGNIPLCSDKCVRWGKKDYTFINVAWIKTALPEREIRAEAG